MNRLAFTFVTLIALSACNKIPGTTENTVAKGKQAAAALLKDPSSAQFRNVQVVEGAVCGEINGKNGYGAYTGFSRFLVLKDGRAGLDPEVDQKEVDAATSQCTNAKGPFHFQSEKDLAIENCERAHDLAQRWVEQAQFEMAFSANCNSHSGK